MDQQTQLTLNSLLILLVVLVQFLLRSRPQTARIQELERRLEQAEQLLAVLEQLLNR